MAKIVNKEVLEYKNGYILSGNDIVGIDNEVVDLLNKIEEDVQRSKYKRLGNIEANIASLVNSKADGFKLKSEHKVALRVKPETPVLDEAIEKTMSIMDELDRIDNTEKMNDYFDKIVPVIMFVNQDFVIECENGVPHRFDLPTIGNPLELTMEDLCRHVAGMFDLDE